MKVNVLSRLAIVSKLNAKKYINGILDELDLGNHYFDDIQKEVDKHIRMDKSSDPKDCWAHYIAGTFFTGSKKYLDGMREGALINSEEMAKFKDKESISRGLDEIKTLRSALNEKKLTAKQKLKEFDDFVKDLRDEIEKSIKAKEAYLNERENYLNDCEKHLKNFK